MLSGPRSRGRGGAGGKTMTFSLKEEVTWNPAEELEEVFMYVLYQTRLAQCDQSAFHSPPCLWWCTCYLLTSIELSIPVSRQKRRIIYDALVLIHMFSTMYSIVRVCMCVCACIYHIRPRVKKCYISWIVGSRMTTHFRPPCKRTETERLAEGQSLCPPVSHC